MYEGGDENDYACVLLILSTGQNQIRGRKEN